MAGLKWHGDSVAAAIHAEMTRRVTACCLIVERSAKELLSVAGTGVRKASVKLVQKDGTKKTLKKGGTVYGANPSKPGEPPRKQTGRLRASVTHEIAGLVGRVGTNVKYGRWLELGTRIVLARPWLRPALAANLARIKTILSAPMKFP